MIYFRCTVAQKLLMWRIRYNIVGE